MQDECRGWDINDVVFSQGLWGMYQPLLRADFKLFDEYVFDEETFDKPFKFPITSFWGTKDRRVKQAMVQRWSKFTTGEFSCSEINGNHLWPLSKEDKEQWLKKITEELRTL